MDAFTKAQITALADGPLAALGFTSPIEVSEWWQYGLRYRNGLRAIDFVIDVEFGSIFVVFIRTLKSDKAADLLSLDNGHPMELAMACRMSGIEYSWTPAKITSEQWQSQLPRAIAYDVQKLAELLAREGAWDKAIALVIEQYQRDTAFVESVVGKDQRLRMDGAPRQTGPSFHAAAPTLIISEWRMKWSMLGRGVLLLFCSVPMAVLLRIAWDEPLPGPTAYTILLAVLIGVLPLSFGIVPIFLARSVWRRGDGALLFKAGPFTRGVIPATDLKAVEIREALSKGKYGTNIRHHVWLVSSGTPQRLTFVLSEWESREFAAAVAKGFGLGTTRSFAQRA